MRLPALVFATLLLHTSAWAAPTGTVTAGGERPVVGTAPPAPQMVTYGTCGSVQNADDFASNPVPVQEDSCSLFQTFSATSAGASNGSSCGGYTVALGPLGDLKRGYKRYDFKATFGDVPTTPAACTATKVAAVAWGYRCDNAACSAGAWERIALPQRKAGVWSSSQNVCKLEVAFAKANKDYNTLNIDIIATQLVNGVKVRKRASGTLEASKGNGKCFSGTATPR